MGGINMKITAFISNILFLLFLCVLARPAIADFAGAIDAGVVGNQLQTQQNQQQMQQNEERAPVIIYKKSQRNYPNRQHYQDNQY